MEITTVTAPAKKTGVLAVLAALMLVTAGASAGLMEKELIGADFTRQLAEIQLALQAPVAETQDKALNMNQVSDLLRDSDPEVRKAAIRGSRALIANTRIYERVMFIMENSGERLDIRVEAARALSYAVQYPKVQDALARTIKYGSAPVELNVMAYKALWGAANGYPKVQAFLIDAVKYTEKDPAARRAAIWALFDSTRNNKPRECLLELLRYGKEDETTAIEAVKSLYGGMAYRDVKELAIAMVRDADVAKPVRLAALLSLSAASGDSRVRNLLESMMRYESDPELRAAAVEASSPSPDKIRDFFHLNYKVENGWFVSPIERE